MHKDRRSLHRQLAVQGLSYGLLLEQVRLDLVKRHLRESDLPLSEVSGLLGFTRLSSFSHWFQQHFGCSASQWCQVNRPGSV
jgi:AraC-like DNA-binding protein